MIKNDFKICMNFFFRPFTILVPLMNCAKGNQLQPKVYLVTSMTPTWSPEAEVMLTRPLTVKIPTPSANGPPTGLPGQNCQKGNKV
jgi:hypothetical protein